MVSAVTGDGRVVPEGPADDVAQPFQIEASNLRGRLVRLDGALDEIVSAHAYPEPVARLLGETVLLAAMLGSALKFEGVFTLQARGDGAVSMLVADVTSDGNLRGYARVNAERLAEGTAPEVPALLGDGLLAFTVDQGEFSEPYQGIVELSGRTLADCLQHYFRQSEQIEAGMRVAVDQRDGRWRGGALMVQRLPDENQVVPSHAEDDWRRAMVLMHACTDDELLDPDLSPNVLLYRLFHEDGVRVFRPATFRPRCRCSRDRVARILASLPRGEVMACKEADEDAVVIRCEFCNTAYRFDDDDLAAVYAQTAQH